MLRGPEQTKIPMDRGGNPAAFVKRTLRWYQVIEARISINWQHFITRHQ
ncbi:hypothetical protein KCP78_18675 [Salmonella enterica subsp. enterica]|nr:hypothetical protein KCP78_18675 [Salmonella enterica subsp. enterica]